MLTLSNIVKDYDVATKPVRALKGVSIAFRPSEFVAILGHSGCGKTTLLNIIGGLDRYTSGDLIIRGRSTKNFKSKDWDTYRNHSVGFVFQSYNLIPHQSVLANVELALTLSGVSKAQRRRRATEALEKVGLGDHLHKKPNQLSGGQMQRVAIARALVNDPEILLADEPTGALDSETSVQVMDLLKQIAQDRLVVMVTHNPELAERYATRTVRLVDGKIVSDSNPYEEAEEEETKAAVKTGRASMSALTAFSLSLSNLLTKKGRTILTAFAGSIGIIGIALILSISTGINNYIDSVEKDTLSSYPLTLESQTIDMSAMMGSMQPGQEQIIYQDDKIYSANIMSTMMDMMLSSATTNNLKDFKTFLDAGGNGIKDLTTEIRYLYATPLNIYQADTSDGIFQINPNTVFEEMGLETGGNTMMSSNMNVWVQLTANQDLMQQQYEVLSGSLPNEWNEVVLVVDENNRITDFTLYSLGLLDIDQLRQALQDAIEGKEPQIDTTTQIYDFADFLGMQFKLLPSSDYFEEQNGVWVDMRENELFMTSQLQKAENVTIVGIVRPKSDAVGTSTGVIGYTGELMLHMIEAVNSSAIVTAQKADPNIDVFTGLPFADPEQKPVEYTMAEIEMMMSMMPQEVQTQLQTLIDMMRGQGKTDEEIAATISRLMAQQTSSATYKGNLQILGVSDLEDPIAINLYPVDFEAKDAIAEDRKSVV